MQAMIRSGKHKVAVFLAVCVAAALALGRRRRPPPAPPAPAPAPAAPQPREVHRCRLWQLGDLAATLAHDLGQPLNVIRLTAEATQDAVSRGQADPARLDRALTTAVAQTLRAQSLLDALTAATRRPAAPPTRLDTVEAVRQALARHLPRFKAADIRLIWHADPAAAAVRGHEARLAAALDHLLINACEAVETRSHQSGGGGTITVDCRPRSAEEGGGVTIVVADDGPGLPPAVAARLVDPWAPPPGGGKGCGLGLTIVQGVVAEMGGSLCADPATPGTRMVLRLPPAQRSVLVVDDDADTAAQLAEALAAAGWRVHQAPGGTAALAAYEAEGGTDAVLTDLEMTGGDGWQLIERLHARTPDLPIIAMSGADADGCRRAVELGAILVLHKPLSVRETVSELDDLFTEGWQTHNQT